MKLFYILTDSLTCNEYVHINYGGMMINVINKFKDELNTHLFYKKI